MEWIKKLVGITKLEDENYKLTTELLTLKRTHETINGANHQLALQVIHLEDELERIKEDPEKYIEEEIEKRLLTLEEELEDKLKHKWMAIGRREGFATYGVQIINDLEEIGDGKEIRMWLGDESEYLCMLTLENVEPEDTGMVTDDGIIIDDLEDIGA